MSEYTMDWVAQREMETSAGFFLPHLHAGMRLLDCGCGPGNITLGFAGLVAPGELVGLDISEKLIERARLSAESKGVANVRFEQGDVYDIPYPDASFDAVWTSSMIQWLDRPMDALREVFRVLKPGGIHASRDRDRRGDLFGNVNPLVRRALDLHYFQDEVDGSSLERGGDLRAMMLDVGYERVVTSASYENHGDEGGPQFIVGLWDRSLRPEIKPWAVKTIKEHGKATDEELIEMVEAWRVWGEDPRSFYSICRVENIAWKPA